MGVGLAWTPARVAVCRARRRRGRIEVTRTASVDLPAHALVPSLSTPNLVDVAACHEALAAALARAQVGREMVAVALPDPSLRVRVLSSGDRRAGTREEQARLLAWELRETLPFPPEQARVAHAPLADGGRPGVLTLVASDAVVSQYEALAERSRLLPVQIGASSLALWNLLEARSDGRGGGVGQGALGALFVQETYATLLVFARGALRLWRCLTDCGSLLDVAREVRDSLCTLMDDGVLPRPLRVLVHATSAQGGGVVERLRAEWDLVVDEVQWTRGLPADPGVLPALGAALLV